MIYETSIDVANAKSLSKSVEGYFGVKLLPTPRFFPADLISEDETLYIEIRCRSCPKDRFPEFIISAAKWIELLRLTFDELRPSVYLAVAWTDCAGLYKIDFGKVTLVPFIRTKSIGTRPEDVMVAIPTNSFQIISNSVKIERSANWN